MRRLLRIVALCLTLATLPQWIYAQGQLGGLTGSILDPSGAVVPAADISITNMATQITWSVKSSSAGYYRVDVPPGEYQLEVRKQGFKASVATKIVVPVAQVVTINLTLEIGSAALSVTVTTTAPLLTTSTAQVSSSVSPQEFQTLPVILSDGARPLDSFIYTSLPGAVSGTGGNSISGGQGVSNSILVDGLTLGRFDANDALGEFSPSTDAVGEFSVVMSNFSAEYGQSGGGVASFSLKSGTNKYHGTLYEYWENPLFNAAGFTENANGQPKSSIRQNDFGGTYGGPIRKNKTFFFAAFEGNRRHEFALGGLTTLPTSAMLKGDFSSWLGAAVGTDALGRQVFKNEIYNPLTTRTIAAGAVDPVSGLTNSSGAAAIIRDPFQGNQIPQTYFSKSIQPLLPLFPTPEFAGNTRNQPYYTGTCCPLFNENKGTLKVDHVINDSMKLSGSLSWNARDRFSHSTGHVFPPYPGYPLNPVKEQTNGGPLARLQFTWTLNPSTVNQVSVGYNRFPDNNGISNDATFAAKMAIPGTDPSCFPPLRFSAGNNPVTALQTGLGQGCATSELSESYEYLDTLTHVRGKHSLKVGAQYLHYRYNTKDEGDVGGTFNFNSASTNLPGFTTGTGNPIASFLLGAVNNGTRGIYTTEPGYRIGAFSFFAQDDFKVSHKLTLNLGVRWELPTPRTEIHNRMSGFDPTLPNPGVDNFPGALSFLGSCGASNCIGRNSFQDYNFKLWAPRFGLAYQITDKLVFRGGYGINYDPNIEFGFGTQNINGFNDEISMNAGTSATGFKSDPVIYLSPLASVSLPAKAQVGVPAYTGHLPNYDPTQVNGGSIDFVPQNSLALPYIQNWSAGFQYQAPHMILLEANYVGSKGTRLFEGNFTQSFNISQTPIKYIGMGDLLNGDLGVDLANPVTSAALAKYGVTKLPFPSFENNPTGNTEAIGLQPYPQYGFVGNNYPEVGSSTYNSLQLSAKKRSSHGLTFIAAYTYSKTLTDADSAMYYGAGTFQDINNLKADKSVASFDFTHYVKLTYIYELPFGHGQRWLSSRGKLDRLVSGWQITMIQNYHSGDPLAILSTVSAGLNNPGIRPDLVPGVPLKLSSSGIDAINGTPYINPAAFVNPPTSPTYQFATALGNSPRLFSNLRGPWGQSETMGLVKDTKLSERVTLQIRADAYNAFNRVIRGDPDTSMGDGSLFGTITADAEGPRVLQFAARINF
jgi:hypothetical protein